MKTVLPFDIPHDLIAGFCSQHHIRRLAFFGSALRDDFRPDSDVDILVDFEQGHVPGFIGIARIERKLSEMLCVRVDLRTSGELSRYFRDEVVADSLVEYVAG